MGGEKGKLNFTIGKKEGHGVQFSKGAGEKKEIRGGGGGGKIFLGRQHKLILRQRLSAKGRRFPLKRKKGSH